MGEALSRRVGRLANGGLHALTDTVGNLAPETAMSENIREVERAVDEICAELDKMLAQKYLVTRKMTDGSNHHETIDANP